MNTIPRLFQDFSWATISSFSANEMVELVMLAVLSIGLVAGVVYGVYIGLFRRSRSDD